jgi:hypothetical protein
MTTLQHLLADKIGYHAKRLRVFEDLQKHLAGQDCELEQATITFCGTLDFDNPTRADVQNLMRVLGGGKWTKEKSGTDGRLNYETEQPVFGGDVKLRLWAAQPPGTCRMVEKKVVIPAEPAKPERIEVRMVLKCEPEVETADSCIRAS